jgi:hypothetical protein
VVLNERVIVQFNGEEFEWESLQSVCYGISKLKRTTHAGQTLNMKFRFFFFAKVTLFRTTRKLLGMLQDAESKGRFGLNGTSDWKLDHRLTFDEAAQIACYQTSL